MESLSSFRLVRLISRILCRALLSPSILMLSFLAMLTVILMFCLSVRASTLTQLICLIVLLSSLILSLMVRLSLIGCPPRSALSLATPLLSGWLLWMTSLILRPAWVINPSLILLRMIRRLKLMRNQESRFAVNPTNISVSRSRFDRDSNIKLSFDVGQLIPFYVDEVLPGDTFSIRTSKVVRMQPMVAPPLDDLFLDTYYFFVPNRLVWAHWQQFQGENTTAPWFPTVEYTVPQVTSPASTGWYTGTIADYMGIPVGVPGISVNALPMRAYSMIVDQWFRDQNNVNPIAFATNDATVTGTNGTSNLDMYKGGYPFIVAKYHDYFTSALPAPQKGPDVMLPLANGGVWPVYAGDIHGLMQEYEPESGSAVNVPLIYSGERLNRSRIWKELGEVNTSGFGSVDSNNDDDTFYTSGVGDGVYNMSPINLWASAPSAAPMATINQLRLAFAVQKAYERDARGGTRYIELLKAHFGVTSPDYRLQRPEYLGGNRVPLNVSQIVQQSSTDATSPQGNPVGLSVTHDTNGDFTHSFTEHGFLIGLCCVRYRHTYQYGLERFWSRHGRFDYYMPVFANIGEQGIRNREIYCQSDSVVDADGLIVNDKIFGYQEAWADYRYKPSRVAGELRSVVASASTPHRTLDYWHFADKYGSLPVLSANWIREDKSNVDRVLAVQSSTSNQLWADIYVQNRTTRVMPLYSIPGLLDHN